MKIAVINGPNLNMLGIREREIYGAESYEALCRRIAEYCREKGVTVRFFQSNHEGDLVDEIQRAYRNADAIVINPGAYTHTSVALRDALSAVGLPAVEVHISDICAREDFRRISYVRDVCAASIVGHGTNGYLEAIDLLIGRFGSARHDR